MLHLLWCPWNNYRWRFPGQLIQMHQKILASYQVLPFIELLLLVLMGTRSRKVEIFLVSRLNIV